VANHKSAKKRIKQNETRRVSNKWKTTRVRTQIKKLREAIEAKDKETATTVFKAVQSLVAKLAKSSALRKDTASRKTSRLATQIAKL